MSNPRGADATSSLRNAAWGASTPSPEITWSIQQPRMIGTSVQQPDEFAPHPPSGHHLHRRPQPQPQPHTPRSVPTQKPPHRNPFSASGNAVSDLLPHCTTEPPLRHEQVIALSDAVGSLKELVVLALGAAAGEARFVGRLDSAVGGTATLSIVEFFTNEWEVEG